MPHIFDLGDDVLLEISDYLTPISIAYFFGSSKRLWELRTKSSSYEQKNAMYKNFCIVYNWDGAMTFASFHGHEQEVQFFIKKGSNDWNWGMSHAAEGGHIKLIEFFIDKGADDWDWGMKQAAYGGHKNIVKFFVDKGANHWNQGMKRAIENDHKDLVEFFIDYGADDWEIGVEQSVKKGSLELLELFDYYADDMDLDWKDLLKQAIICRKRESVEYCMGKTTISNWNEFLIEAALYGQKDIVELFIAKGATDFNSAMVFAVSSGNQELVKFFVEKGANNWPAAMQEAVVQGNIQLVTYLDSLLDDIAIKSIDWDVLMCSAISIGNQWIVQYCISKGANNWFSGLISSMNAEKTELLEFFASRASVPELNEAMKIATNTGRKDYLELLLAKGATDVNQPLSIACAENNRQLLDFLMKQGANDWNLGLVGATMSRQQDLIDFFIQKGADIEYGMCAAALHGHRDLVFFFVQKGSCGWKDGLISAALGGHVNIVKFFIRKGVQQADIVDALEVARVNSHQHVIDALLEDFPEIHKVYTE